MLALLRHHIVDVRIHLVVGIGHRLLPQLFPLGRQRLRAAPCADACREMTDQITKQVHDAAGIFVAEAAELAIGAARVEREDRLQMRRLLLGDGKLLGAEAGNADHADIAVAPRLRRDPFDQIVAVPLARAAAFRFADAARLTDHVNIAARHEESRVAGLHRAGPQRRPRRLRRQAAAMSGPCKSLL